MKITITIEELQGWDACSEGLEWFQAQFGDSLTTTLDEFVTIMQEHKDWLAWWLYKAGCYWPDKRYNQDISTALIATGKAKWLYGASLHWPDKRYNQDILTALIAIGKAGWLYKVGREWPDKRKKDLK